MTTDPKLENYLTALEQALRPLPVSERAEIILEIKSHVLSAMEKDSLSSMDSILNALGSAQTVANRYLMERDFTVTKPPISPIVKWIVIGFLGSLALLLTFVTVLIFQIVKLDSEKFIDIDERRGRISLMDGRVKINSDDDIELEHGESIEVNGRRGEVRIKDGQITIHTYKTRSAKKDDPKDEEREKMDNQDFQETPSNDSSENLDEVTL